MTNPIEELRRAHEATTQGEWHMETLRTSCGVCHKIGPWPHKWRAGEEMSACIYDDYPSPPEGTDTMLANAHFIALAHREWPALLDEIERLREALTPFAECCEQISEDEDGEEWAKFRLLIKDYRLARTALGEKA